MKKRKMLPINCHIFCFAIINFLLQLKKPGGLYEKKLADDYEVLVVPKGSWVEAIFAKEKPKVEKVRMRFDDENDLKRNDDLLDPDEVPSAMWARR